MDILEYIIGLLNAVCSIILKVLVIIVLVKVLYSMGVMEDILLSSVNWFT